MMHSNAGRSNSSGQRRRRSLRNNNNSATSRPATSTMHSNYSNPTNASTVALATLDTAPFLHRYVCYLPDTLHLFTRPLLAYCSDIF